jgi:hypothetical protein
VQKAEKVKPGERCVFWVQKVACKARKRMEVLRFDVIYILFCIKIANNQI